jgi:hypothetical protein
VLHFPIQPTVPHGQDDDHDASHDAGQSENEDNLWFSHRSLRTLALDSVPERFVSRGGVKQTAPLRVLKVPRMRSVA